ncbi:MAG: glycosyltransferase family 39 protein, partial [Lentisphaeria bacterium]|nr:glycosyltransferase family 39 protein [Lentisphaeria bacterium]
MALLVLIWLVPLAFFCNLLLSGDETRVAGISAGILLTQDWLVPYLNGKPFLEYPPLYYWWVGLFLKIFGVCEWAASLASTVAAAGSVGLVWKIVRRTGGSDMLAAAAGMMMMSSAQFLDDSHMVRADILLTFFVALAFYGFCILVRCGGTSRKWDDFRG